MGVDKEGACFYRRKSFGGDHYSHNSNCMGRMGMRSNDTGGRPGPYVELYE